MSAIRLKFPSVNRTATLLNRLPKPLTAWAPFSLAAFGLAVALCARKFPPFDFKPILGSFVISAVAMLLTAVHLRTFPTKGVERRVAERIMWLTALLTVLGLQIGVQALGDPSGVRHQVGPLTVAPLVTLGMLVSGLLGPAKGIFAVCLVAIGAIAVRLTEPGLLIGGALAASVGAHAVNPMRHRNDLFRATYATTLAFAIVALAVSLSAGEGWVNALWTGSWGVAAGVGASAIFWLAIAAFERAFGVVSDWSLLELCNPDQPLLRQLMLRAPGTYAHSVMVGNLADQAAPAVGANALLCRTMAYYHDIGKMRRPEFFIENKLADNPHEKLNPTLSAKIIASHVRDGLKIADEHHLPPAVKEGIAEHHGTSLISYFYQLHSQETGEEDPILELHFRYSGPRPRSKETAVLMLADRVEAATRTLANASPGRLRTFVWEIIQDVRDDGQLDDSALNFRDLQTLVDSFVNSLTALRHERVDYPTGTFDGLDEDSPYSDRQPYETPYRDDQNKSGAD